MNKKEASKILKRFLLVFLCCIPIFVVMGIFLTNKIPNIVLILIYVIIGAGAFLLEEIWWNKHLKKLELRKEKARLRKKYEARNRGYDQANDTDDKKSRKDK